MAQVCMPVTGTRSLAAIDVLTADKDRRMNPEVHRATLSIQIQ